MVPLLAWLCIWPYHDHLVIVWLPSTFNITIAVFRFTVASFWNVLLRHLRFFIVFNVFKLLCLLGCRIFRAFTIYFAGSALWWTTIELFDLNGGRRVVVLMLVRHRELIDHGRFQFTISVHGPLWDFITNVLDIKLIIILRRNQLPLTEELRKYRSRPISIINIPSISHTTALDCFHPICNAVTVHEHHEKSFKHLLWISWLSKLRILLYHIVIPLNISLIEHFNFHQSVLKTLYAVLKFVNYLDWLVIWSHWTHAIWLHHVFNIWSTIDLSICNFIVFLEFNLLLLLRH